MKFSRKSALTKSLLLIASSSSLYSATVIDNLSPGGSNFSTSLSGPTATTFGGFQPFADREAAFTFTTGSNPGSLSQMEAIMRYGEGNAAGSPVIAALSTGPSVPGGTNSTTLGSVTLAQISTEQTLSFTPASPIPLSASTQYWVHFTVDSGDGVYTLGNTNTPTTAPGWSLGDSYSKEPGTPWESITPSNGDVARVRITTIPEPSSALLTVCGFLILTGRRRRLTK